MENAFYSAFINFCAAIDVAVVFLIVLSAMSVFTVVECILCVTGKLSDGKIMLHAGFTVGAILSVTALSSVNASAYGFAEKLFFPLLTAASGAVTFVPVKLFRAKPIIKPEHLDLAELLDKEYVKESRADSMAEKPQVAATDKVTHLKIRVPAPEKTETEIDFTHVKNVIERLNYYNLGPTDKRTVNDLANNVSQAENGEFTPELKEKINDGLGALLKIMSKYGV